MYLSKNVLMGLYLREFGLGIHISLAMNIYLVNVFIDDRPK